MPLTLTWQEVAIRLTLSVVAGALIGLDRGERGRAAGLRTTLLVCLAAAVAMVQTNLLLATRGRSPDSFIMMDLMRLPLGILTGLGFFGGGQIGLGVAGTALGMMVLSGLRWFDYSVKKDQHGELLVTTDGESLDEGAIREIVQKAGYKIVSVSSVAWDKQTEKRSIEFLLQWRAVPEKVDTPPFLQDLLNHSQVATAHWKVS